MLLLKSGGSAPVRTSLAGVVLVIVGLAILLSGLALLIAVAAAGAALGGAVMVYRRLVGKAHLHPARRHAVAPLELEADFEMLPPARDRQGADPDDPQN